jgi:hypothetical protein
MIEYKAVAATCYKLIMLTMLHELRADKILDANVSQADTRFRKNSDLRRYKFNKPEKQYDKVLSQRRVTIP